MTEMNRQITLARRPPGLPGESDFKLVESPVPEPGPGEVLARTLVLSVDPYMRSRMRDAKSYAPPVQIGETMVGGTVSRIIRSNHPDFREGDIVEGRLGWQDYAISNGEGLRKVDPALAPISTALGVLGMPGLTAYFGLLEICQPKEGETVVVSAAAGAVGSLVGQIAKIKGCHVVGTAGRDDKVRWVVEELGFDAAYNYKEVKDHASKLASLCPNGIDAYFDNVGGVVTDAVFPLINTGARIAICGQISQYNLESPELGPRFLWNLIRSQARIEGFLVWQFQHRQDEGLRQMAQWIAEGRLQYHEEFVDGLENTPKAFLHMLQGGNLGKQLVRVAE